MITKSSCLLSVLLVAIAGASCGDAAAPEVEIAFEGRRDLWPRFEHDTGFVPTLSPAAIRIVARGEGGVVARARAIADGSSMSPVAGSGELVQEGELVLEVSARIDTAGFSFEGVVDTFSYAIEPATTSFDPFLLDGTAMVESALPPSELARVPVPSVPGATLVVEVTGGTMSSSLRGVCAETVDGVGQYIAKITTNGVVELAGTIEIDIPIVGKESFGPFELAVDSPQFFSNVDLGAFSLKTAEPADGVMPCDETDEPQVDLDEEGSSEASSGPISTSTTGAATTTAMGDTTTTGSSDDSGSTDDTGSTDDAGSTTGAPASDPVYPDPTVEDCPPGTDWVEGPGAMFCSPLCTGGVCPDAATGTAEPACDLSPLSSFEPCTSTADCPAGETCDIDLCIILPPTHCILLCDAGQLCPDGMTCFFDFCAYPE